MKRRWVSLYLAGFIALALILSLLAPAFANGSTGPARKIVVFQNWVNEAAQDEILAHTGAYKVKQLPLINAAVVLAGPASERALQQQAGVVRIDDDAIASIQAKPSPPSPPPETLPWGVDRIDAELAWSTSTGAGVKVAILDTGIDLDHPDLQANIKGGINTISPLKSADDDNGHGSHVAGTIGAVDNSIGAVGVAPQAWLYAVKVLNRQGSGFVSDIIEGIQWSIDNGMQVINMSFGTSSDIQAFHEALIAASNAGIVLVAAAGNSGPGDDTVAYPAKYLEVIAVSATNSSDTITSWSSRGLEVELAAPGDGIYSTYKGGSYKTLSGTSMASPHVAGTAALVIAANPTWTASQVRTSLQTTADDLGDPGVDNLYGNGLVDAQEATTRVQTLP